jgi:hypothetical protein
MKKLINLTICSFLLLNLYGCVAILFGTVGGAGTAVWLSGKLVQQVQAPYDKTIEAAKTALKSMNLEIAKEAKAHEVTQIRSYYTDGRKIWIDIRPVSETSTGIEVRVGVFGDRIASDVVLKKITSNL